MQQSLAAVLSVLLAPLKNPLCQHSMNSIHIRNISFTSQMKGRCYHIKGLLLKLNPYHCNICFAQETTSGGHFTRKYCNTTCKTPQRVACNVKIWKIPRFSFLIFSSFSFISAKGYSPQFSISTASNSILSFSC